MNDSTETSPSDQPRGWRTWHYGLLWLIAFSSLVMNVALTAVLLNFNARLQAGVFEVTEMLDRAELEDIELAVVIDETLPISITIPFSDTFTVPIQTTIPVETTILFEDVIQVPIRTTIPIDTDFIVQVDIPLVGRTGIPIPIVTNIPIDLVVDVPISRQIPVVTDIEVDIMVDVPVQSQIPVQTEVPVQLDVPVTISLDQLGFEALITQLRQSLRTLVGGSAN